jgi:bacteriorhodopsin
MMSLSFIVFAIMDNRIIPLLDHHKFEPTQLSWMSAIVKLLLLATVLMIDGGVTLMINGSAMKAQQYKFAFFICALGAETTAMLVTMMIYAFSRSYAEKKNRAAGSALKEQVK